MINKKLILLFTGFALIGCSFSKVHAYSDIDINYYLIEVKEFINCDRSVLNIPLYLRQNIETLNRSDYVGHFFIGTRVLNIQFKKKENDEEFKIALHVDLSKDRRCGRINAYEVQ